MRSFPAPTRARKPPAERRRPGRHDSADATGISGPDVCTYLTTTEARAGPGSGALGWFGATKAVVSFDHPEQRVAVEIDAASGPSPGRVDPGHLDHHEVRALHVD